MSTKASHLERQGGTRGGSDLRMGSYLGIVFKQFLFRCTHLSEAYAGITQKKTAKSSTAP